MKPKINKLTRQVIEKAKNEAKKQVEPEYENVTFDSYTSKIDFINRKLNLCNSIFIQPLDFDGPFHWYVLECFKNVNKNSDLNNLIKEVFINKNTNRTNKETIIEAIVYAHLFSFYKTELERLNQQVFDETLQIDCGNSSKEDIYKIVEKELKHLNFDEQELKRFINQYFISKKEKGKLGDFEGFSTKTDRIYNISEIAEPFHALRLKFALIENKKKLVLLAIKTFPKVFIQKSGESLDVCRIRHAKCFRKPR